MRLCEYLSVTEVDTRDGSRFVYFHDHSGTSFSLDRTTHHLLQAVQKAGSVDAAVQNGWITTEHVDALLPTLSDSGLLVGDAEADAQGIDRRPKPKKPLEARLFFPKVHLFWIDGASPWCRDTAAALFSKAACWAYVATLVLALWAVAGQLNAFGADLRAAAQISAPSVLLGLTVALLFLKAVHEFGHAFALMQMLRAEKHAAPVVQFGISTFFLMPFPFTNAGRTWLLASKWRRMSVGLGGVYLETWVAAFAILAWSVVGAPEIRAFLAQIALVAGVTTLLFNLNPLLRLDGYYVLFDWLEEPNVATRANQEWKRRLHALIGIPGAGEGLRFSWITVYGVGAFLQRLALMTGVALLALAVDPALALIVAGVIAVMLVGRPLCNLAQAAYAARESTWRPLLRATVGLLLVAALPFVPIQRDLVLDGTLHHEDLRTFFPQRAGVLMQQAGPRISTSTEPSDASIGANEATPTVMRVGSVEDELKRAQLVAEQALAELQLRRALSGDPAEIAPRRKDWQAAQLRLTTLERVLAENKVALRDGEIWAPALGDRRVGSWVTPRERQPEGTIIPSELPTIRFIIQEADANLAPDDLLGMTVPVRIWGTDQRNLYSRIVTVAKSSSSAEKNRGDQNGQHETHMRVLAQLLPGSDLGRLAYQGKVVSALLERPSEPAWRHASRWLSQLLIRRG